MNNFDYKKYIAEGKLLKEEGYSESVNEAKAEPIVDLLDQGKWANVGMGEKKLVKLSDAFDAIGDEQADAIASHLNMAIELMQEREKKSAVPHMNKFNKACVKELKLMKKQGLAESVNGEEYPTSAPRVYVVMLGNKGGPVGPYRVYADKSTAEAEAAQQKENSKQLGSDIRAFVQDLAYIK